MRHPIRAAATGHRPRRGIGRRTAGALRLDNRRRNCGLDTAVINGGDEPVAVLILVIGAVVVGLALWVERSFTPLLGLDLLLLPPVGAAAMIGALRLMKGARLALALQHSAAAARRERPL